MAKKKSDWCVWCPWSYKFGTVTKLEKQATFHPVGGYSAKAFAKDYARNIPRAVVVPAGQLPKAAKE